MNTENLVSLRTYLIRQEADLALLHLQSEGITAVIQSDDCGGMRPGLHTASGLHILVSVSDREKAEEILSRFEKNLDGPEGRPEPSSGSKRTVSWWIFWISLLGGFIAGVITGVIAVEAYSYLKYLNSVYYHGTEEIDTDADFKTDLWYHYSKGRLSMVESDRNRDEKPDDWRRFSPKNIYNSTYESDNNFDGAVDNWVYIIEELPVFSKTDTDFNGKPDALAYYTNGVIYRIDLYPNESKYIERKQLFANGILKEEYIDDTQDGIFDRKIEYDPMQRVIKTTDM
jgi:hypothetical protein